MHRLIALIPNPSPSGRREPDFKVFLPQGKGSRISKSLSLRERDLAVRVRRVPRRFSATRQGEGYFKKSATPDRIATY
jgi:hypothetical protein